MELNRLQQNQPVSPKRTTDFTIEKILSDNCRTFPALATEVLENDEIQGRPPLSYTMLTINAIRESPAKRMTVNEIYQAIMAKYPFYRKNFGSWKGNIRTSLTLYDIFVKEPRAVCGFYTRTGSYWKLHPKFDYEHNTSPSRLKLSKGILTTRELNPVLYKRFFTPKTEAILWMSSNYSPYPYFGTHVNSLPGDYQTMPMRGWNQIPYGFPPAGFAGPECAQSGIVTSKSSNTPIVYPYLPVTQEDPYFHKPTSSQCNFCEMNLTDKQN